MANRGLTFKGALAAFQVGALVPLNSTIADADPPTYDADKLFQALMASVS